MTPERLEALRFAGYAPRTLLDIGAHLGGFTQRIRAVFPDCVPTLVEPNPHCHADLVALGFEAFPFAAAAEAGEADFHLSREWPQSTGASLYRENTAHFRDEVLERVRVPKRRIDDVFEGRRFDFIKIDTQGAELDVLRGGRRVLRQADYILIEVSLVEYNQGGAAPEDVFAALAELGFRSAEVAEFHRLRGVRDGALLQMDFLFEREVRRPAQAARYATLHDHAGLLAWLAERRARCPDFSVIDVGAAANPWSASVIDATFDLNDCPAAPLHFTGNLNDRAAWDGVLRHVARHGRFAYAICAHTLEDLAYPAMTLEMLPRIADAGFVSVPSRYLESLMPEGPYRGFIHHRWVLDQVDGTLVIAPKVAVLEHLQLRAEAGWAGRPDRLEFQLHWRGTIAFAPLNGDYLGPSRDHVIGLLRGFLDRP